MSVAVPSVPSHAGAIRGVVLQTQGCFQRLGDGVGAAEGAVDLALGDKCRQTEVVVPEIESVVIGSPRLQVPAV